MLMRPTEQQTLTCVHGRGTALGSLGLVERCYRPSSRVVRAYDTNVPQQWNERRWSSGTKNTRATTHTHKMFFLTWKWSFGVYESNESYAFGKERCAFYPSAKLCEKKKRE